MKNKKWVVLTFSLASVMAISSVSFAAAAPVEDITSHTANSQPAENKDPETQQQSLIAPRDMSSVVATQNDNTSTSATQAMRGALPLPKRIRRLEQQTDNLTNMNLPQQIAELQQHVAELRGQLQVQAHDLKLLNSQQRSFYQDLDERISQLKNLGINAASNAAAVSNQSSDKLSATNKANTIQMKDANAYRQGFELVVKRQYPKAINVFQNYLNDFPNGAYVANVHYWLGEIYMVQKNVAAAKTEFDTVIQQYPKSNKVADATLKLAIIHANEGQVQQARDELNKIKKSYPGSTTAQLAAIRLQQLDLKNNKPPQRQDSGKAKSQ